MRTPNRSVRPVSRLTSALAALSLVAVLPGAAMADHTEVATGDGQVTSTRWAGENRFDTAAKIAVESSAAVVAEPATAVIVANGLAFPDALAGAYLSRAVGAPVLLTGPGGLPTDTRARLTSTADTGLSSATTAYVLGGTAAVSTTVADELEGLGLTVIRIGGANRIATAANIASVRPAATIGELDGQRTAILSRSDNFPDALVAGVTSYAGQFPILLTPRDGLAEDTRTALTDLGIEQVLVAGGGAAISEAVVNTLENDLGLSTRRIFGTTREGTATAFADFNTDELGFTNDRVGLVRGDSFPDALAFGPYAGRERFSIVLASSPTSLGAVTEAHLAGLATCSFDGLAIPGGTSAISEAVEAAARAALTATGCEGVDNAPPVPATIVAQGNVAGVLPQALPGPTDDSVVITFDEAVTCSGAVPAQFIYVSTTGTTVSASTLDCTGQTVTIGFGGGTLPTDGAGLIRYRPSTSVDARLADTLGNQVVAFVTPLVGQFTVDTTADTPDANLGDGLAEDSNGATSLRAAIQEANALDIAITINIPAGVHTLTRAGADEDAAATGDLDVTDDLTIVGAGPGATIIDGDRLDRVFHLDAPTTSLSGLTITGGNAAGETGKGGGILLSSGVLTLSDSSLESNDAGLAGGGLENAGATATLTDVDFRGNLAGANGGALHVTGAGSTTVTGGVVDTNIALREGGGFWNGSADMTVTGTDFRNNVASGPDSHDGGGALFNNGGALTIDGVSIGGNVADGASGSGGGIFSLGGTLMVMETTLDTNSANRAGGGIEAQDGAAITVTDTDFTGNVAGPDGSAAPGNGGAIHLSDTATAAISGGAVTGNVAAREGGGFWNASATMAVTGTVFTRNIAAGDAADDGGGALFNSGGTLTITGATITDGRATGASGSGGGVFSLGGTTTILETTIDSSSATRAGGGIEGASDTTITITDSTLSNNVASAAPGNGGGLHLSDTSDATITGGAVTGNVAASEGGGLWGASGVLTIDGTTIGDNRASGADSTNGGGGVFGIGGTVSITDATLTFNTADGAAGSGGGVLIDGGTLTITNSTIADNSAARAGGGIEGVNDATITITSTDLTDNSTGAAPGNGGGLHLTDTSDATITGGTVTGNTAASEGGGLWGGGGTLSVDGTTISGNTASGADASNGGGGVFGIGGTVTITNATISGNSADGAAGSGGGVLVDGAALTITDSTLSGNDAARAGGGIEGVNDGASVTLVRTDLTSNVAGGAAANPGNGGGLHVTGDVPVAITAGIVSGNTASREGGGLWNGSSTMSITGTAIRENTASGDESHDGGGGIFNNGGTLTISDAVIEGNAADGAAGSGGGVQSLGGSIEIFTTRIDTNTANRAGGGIEFNTVLDTDSAQISLSGVDFDGNDAGSAPGNGGALHITGSASSTIVGGTVQNNTGTEGGGFWNGTGLMQVFDTVFLANDATGTWTPTDAKGGGAVFNAGGTVNLSGVVARLNTASGTGGSGGAVLSDGGTLFVFGDSVLDGNTAARAGGGIEIHVNADHTELVYTQLTNATLKNNSAGVNGGGFHVTDGDARQSATAIIDSVIVGNSAVGEGGGTWNHEGTMTLTNTTIAENSAANGGGHFQKAGGSSQIDHTTIVENGGTAPLGAGGGVELEGAGATVTFTNSIVLDNGTGTACRANGGTFATNGGNLTEGGCAINGTNDANGYGDLAALELTPVDDADGDVAYYAPAATSDVVDNGVAGSFARDGDQLGNPRDGSRDTGSIEYIAP